METETSTTLAAFDAAQAQLAATTTADLLRAAYSLTHRIHAAEGRCGFGRVDGNPVDLRQQRDMIDAEILRRVNSLEARSLRVVR